jgi:hypothetical protein
VAGKILFLQTLFNMKIRFYSLIALLLLMTCVSGQLLATSHANTPKTAITATPITPEAQVMLSRLETIQAMDLKGMPRAEKKQLRNEVKEIKSNLQAANGGVYLSVGAIIIILLLIILLL